MLNSIRTRLTLWFTSVLAVILIAFAISAYLFLVYAIHRQTDETLQQIAQTFIITANNEEADEDEKKLHSKKLEALHETLNNLNFHNYKIFVSDANGEIFTNDETKEFNFPDEKIKSLMTSFSASSENERFFQLSANDCDYRIFARKITLANGEQLDLFIVHVLDDEKELLSQFRNALLVSVPLMLVFVGFGGYFLAQKVLLPVAQMSETASRISATNLSERLPVKNPKDEFGNLAKVINELLERLEKSFQAQRQFVADASHELRTPLAIVRGESEIALSKNNRTKEELRQSLSIIHDESKRLTHIVEDLFILARADSGHFRANFKELYLDELLADCVRKVRVLADKHKISLDFQMPAEMPMRGDEQLLRRLFLNLLDNAIKYNREDGTGRVSVRGEITADSYRITISDTGIGIPKEQQAKIFERFYRIDKARSRKHETLMSGAGLGLSIAKWIAEIHQGNLELVSSDETGSIFAINLPKKNLQ